MNDNRKRNWWPRLTVVALLIGAAQGLLVGTSSGEEADGQGAVVSAASAQASAATPPVKTLELFEGKSTCDRCTPRKVEVEFVFSAPVDAEDLAEALEITPTATLEPVSDVRQRRVRIKGSFGGATSYEITVPGGFCAVNGACLTQSAKVQFTTGGGYPRARMPVRNTILPPGGKIPMRFQHVEEATITLIALRDNEVGAALSVAGGYHWDTSPLTQLADSAQKRAKKLVVKPREQPKPEEYELDPFEHVQGEQVFVMLEAPGTNPKAAVYQRAGVGVLTKVGTDDGLVWVTDTRNGKPIRSAQVALYHGDRATYRGSTNQDGIVRLPARQRLIREGAKGPLFAIVKAQGRTHVTGTDWTDGLEPWMFDIPYHYYSGEKAIRGMITAERGIYRPGEPVHALGVLRKRLGNGRLAPPVGSVELTVKDPDGTRVVQKRVHLTAYGTLRSSFRIPEAGKVGRYTMRVEKDGVTFHHSFEVGDFRAATFEVQMPQAGPAEIESGEVVVPFEAKYLYGAPVAGGKAKYQVSVRQRRAYFAGYERYHFSSGSYWGYRHPEMVTEGEVELDEQGRAELRLPLSSIPKPKQDHSRVVDVIVEATVTDAADDTITARTVQRVDRAKVFVGVNSDSWVVSPKGGWDVQVVALDPTGQPVKGEALEVEVERTYYNSIAEKGPHGVRYRTSREEEIVYKKTVKSSDRPLDLHFDLPGGGNYTLRVKRAGEPYVSSRSVWAYGRDASSPSFNNPRIELTLDKESYEPGDTAMIYGAVPYPKSTALLTIERSGVMHAEVIELGGTDTALKLQVTTAHLPNAFVGLAVIPRSKKAMEGVTGYPFRAGYANLKVSTDARRLHVSVEPQDDELEPGEDAQVKVVVRDHQNRPVRAEVTLWAADEGVLMLTGYQTPDPFAPAYARYSLDVTNATNLSRWTHYDPSAWADGGGDSSGGPASALRSRFMSTAHFSKGVVTNAQGEATVGFDLPDNVTRWRLMAVAADRGQRFGKGESAIRASKPIQVLPSLPRFVTEGDLVDAGLVVHNHTGKKAKAKVTLDVVGAKRLGNRVVEIEVPNGQQRQVRYPLVVESAGELVVRAHVSGNDKDDGFEIRLPAHRSTTESSIVVSEGSLKGTKKLHLGVPPGARPGTVELELLVSPSILASLGPGVEALLEYPYGCAEQKTSRLVPMALLGDLINQLEIAGFDQEAHRSILQKTISELEKHQNHDGGMGLWPESSSDPWVTAYVLFGWTVAREEGYSISSTRFNRGIRYLQSALKDETDVRGYFGYNGAPMAAYVLGRNKSSDEGLAARLFDARATLGFANRGLLAVALGGQSNQRQNQFQLLAELEALKTSRAGVVDVAGDPSSGYFGYGRDLRATAVLVHALVAAGRARDAEPYVRGVLSLRQANGTWGTTYDNLWALLALNDYAKSERAALRSGAVVVKLGGEKLGEVNVGAGDVAKTLVIPADQLPKPGYGKRLELTTQNGVELEHVVRLRYVPKPTSQPAAAHGYTIHREVFDAKTDAPVSSPKVGQLLRVELTVENQSYRHQVALTDRLPAGLEAVNTKLATSQKSTDARSDYTWRSAELRDERVSFFSYGLSDGVHEAKYLVRATRSGEFVWPAATVESMYAPDEYARTGIDQMVIER